jgi:putative thioredoxin
MSIKPHVFEAATDTFEAEVLTKSMQTPVLVDFWAPWCGPCKTLGPILEKLAGEYNGAFELAKVDVDKEQQIAAAFQIRSVPTVFLVKDGQVVDGFPGAVPESQLREFLKQHGVEPLAAANEEPAVEDSAPIDPQAALLAAREAADAAPEKSELKLDLALALLDTGAHAEAQALLDALPANLGADDRTLRARTRLEFAAVAKDAPPVDVLEAALATDPADMGARHLLGVKRLVSGDEQQALEHFLDMLRRDRSYEDGLPRKLLIDAFRVIGDDALVGQYRRKMAALLF